MAARLTTYLVVAIVSVTLIAGLIVGAQRDDDDGPIDVIIHNGVVYKADGNGSLEEALAIRGNKVLRVGDDREILRLQRPQTTVIDARGGAVLPGFNDSDARLVAGGLALGNIDLAGASAVDEIAARIRTWAEANPDRPWVIGRGLDAAVPLDRETPRQWLDGLVPDKPVVMWTADTATAWANTAALASIAPQGMVAAKESGLVTGPDLQRLADAAPRPARTARAAAVRAAITEAQRHGITSVQHVGASADELELYAEAVRESGLGVRVYAAVPLGAARSDQEIARFEAIADKYPDDPILKAGAVAIALDGSIGSGTAAMLQPLAGREDPGAPLVSADDLNRVVRLLDARGWQVIVRASGDRAVRMALDAFQHAARSNPAPARGRRHRIEGVELIDPADLRRLKSLGAVISIDVPVTLGAATRASYVALLGEERAARLWALRTATSAGATLTAGSGWPAGPINPLFGIHAWVTGTSPTGDAEEGWSEEERVTVRRAVQAMTSAGAFASFDEHRKGTLKAGMLADVVVLSQDIFSIPPARLAGVEVTTTIFDGRVVYRRDRVSLP